MQKNNRFIKGLAVGMTFVMMMTGCSSGSGGTSNGRDVAGIKTTTTAIETTEANKRYNSQDIAVIVDINESISEISLKSVNTNKKYSLKYTGGTRIKSKNNSELTMSDMSVGMVVDVYSVQGSQKLIELHENKESWKNDTVGSLYIDTERKKITIGSNSYRYDDSLYVASAGHEIGIDEISDVDELVVRGFNGEVVSVVVTRGHGYVRFTDDVYMIGGLVEIGSKIMTAIEEDMVIVAPEGTYTLTATKDGVGGSKDITVARDEELTVSLSEFKKEVTRYGSIKLSILPEGADARVYIDGVQKDYSDLITVPYGKHKLVIESDDYETFTKIITTASLYTTITVDFDEDATSDDDLDDADSDDSDGDADDDSKDNDSNDSGDESESTKKDSDNKTTEGNDATASTNEQSETSSKDDDSYIKKLGTHNNKLVFTSPSGAILYIDGIKQGTVPVTISKTSGKHTVLLMMTGYKSKVYSINLDTSDEDLAFAYPALTKSDN